MSNSPRPKYGQTRLEALAVIDGQLDKIESVQEQGQIAAIHPEWSIDQAYAEGYRACRLDFDVLTGPDPRDDPDYPKKRASR